MVLLVSPNKEIILNPSLESGDVIIDVPNSQISLVVVKGKTAKVMSVSYHNISFVNLKKESVFNPFLPTIKYILEMLDGNNRNE